jgi:branched-chain amino acid transport system permease protein
MASTTSPTAALSVRQVTGKSLAAAGLLVAVAVWLVWNFTESPSAFLRVSIIGLQNGALYALIALGYTLVYGIIELINFAHGDLFMLGSLFGMFLLGRPVRTPPTRPPGCSWSRSSRPPCCSARR